ncbi:MAG: DUF1549 and DUF1553 domain-containing protein [Planctomycetia bacterium]|nr:DUF1549 and DUF1553 domain-containing protein [Planctomycetia bacterium]
MRSFFAVAVSVALLIATSALAAPPVSAKKIPWAFKPLTAKAPPTVANTTWPSDDLDRFILADQESAGLKPNADADRTTLLRRLTFDLTGLPPTEQQLVSFLGDKSSEPVAVARVVDALLASPQFGERWARHWLDVVRYADSVGRTYNPPFTYAWRYRDYVIDAFNRDTPYDRFITEQLAGDLLPYKTVEERRRNLTATGMLALGSHDLQGGDQSQFEMDCVDDQIDVTSRAMLGLTIACARCHDHKYDPISTRDYYALAGIFYSSRIRAGVSYRGAGNGYVDHDKLIVLPVAQGSRTITPTLVPGVHSTNDFNAIWSTGRRDIRYTTDPNLCVGVEDDEIADCEICIKGDPHDRAPAPPRGDLRIPNLAKPAKIPSKSSGRLELARWIATPTHPLTARVVTNRVWQHLFGSPLASTPDDFGATSEGPTHPELLDHLAVRLTKNGWSIKQLIRAIVLSRTYRLSADTASNAAAKSDPDNRLYWRANLRRLEFEPLRDAMLAASGKLSLDPPTGIQVAGIGGKSNKTSVAGLLDVDDACRTIYLPVVRSRLPESYGTFDFPDPCQIAGRRDVTTVAPQALFFMNGSLATDCADRTIDQLLNETLADDSARVRLLYRRLLGRNATADEVRSAGQMLTKLTSSIPERWSTLAQALMCSAEFRYVR